MTEYSAEYSVFGRTLEIILDTERDNTLLQTKSFSKGSSTYLFRYLDLTIRVAADTNGPHDSNTSPSFNSVKRRLK